MSQQESEWTKCAINVIIHDVHLMFMIDNSFMSILNFLFVTLLTKWLA